MLFLLALIPLFIVFYILMQIHRRRLTANFSRLGFAPGGGGRKPGVRRHLPQIFFLAGLAVLIVALARPRTVVGLPVVQGTVILAFDVSGSMAADDMKPTRMNAAKAAAQQFVERQPTSVQIGVVAFSDGGFAVQAPTDDRDAILAAIGRLTPERSTSIGQGILASLNTIAASLGQNTTSPDFQTDGDTAEPPAPTPVPPGTHAPAIIILLSDGENTASPGPLEAAQTAAERGVRIYTIGVGSPAGALLNVEGFSIHTQLDEAMLQQIALFTDGAYYNAENEQDLQAIYGNLNPQLVIKQEETEVTSLFAGASILVLLIGGALSFLWFGRLP